MLIFEYKTKTKIVTNKAHFEVLELIEDLPVALIVFTVIFVTAFY